MMRTSRICLGFVVLLISIFFCSAALAEGYLVPGEGTLVERWDPGMVPSMTITFTEAGVVQITGGWVFDAPLSLNGEAVATGVIPGESAEQITPFTRTVSAGETWVWEPTQAASGSELGIRYLYTVTPPQPACQEMEINLGRDQNIVARWNGDVLLPCLRTTFKEKGVVSIKAGWVFSAPLSLNNEMVNITIVSGEAAPQIEAFYRVVEAGEVWEWKPTRMETGTELGIWLDHLKVYYLPTVSK